MAKPIRMPDIGTVEGEVLLSRWLKAEGETVRMGEPLLEVETDKGVNELESVADGVLLRRLVAEGAKVAAGDLIAYVGEAGEALPAPAEGRKVTGAPPESLVAAGATAPMPAAAKPGRIPPSLRLLAEKRGVDLAAIPGSGPGGAVTRADILAARPGAPARAGGAARTRLTGNQAAIARKVSKSWAEAPVYHVSMQVDMSRAAAFRATTPVSYDALFVHAVGMGLAEFPVFRSHLEAGEVVQLTDCAVALAVGVEDELYAPVLKAAASRSAADLSREIEGLAARAKSRTLAPAEMEGGCILVSNLGMLPVESFDAIVYPGHSAALAVGAALPTPVAVGGEIRVAPLARLTLSADHRLINGKTAARFLARVKQILENGDFA